LLPEAPRIEFCNDESACPFAPSITTAPGCPVYEGQSHLRSNPPTPPFSDSDAQEQAVVGSRIRQSSNREASQSCENAPFEAAVAIKLAVILQRSYRSKKEYRSIMPAQECRRILRKLYVIKRLGNQWPPELCRPRPVLMDTWLLSVRRTPSADKAKSHHGLYNGIQTRSKIRPKSNRIAPSRMATLFPHTNNTARGDESDTSAAIGKTRSH
jgi:hypothetical protein